MSRSQYKEYWRLSMKLKIKEPRFRIMEYQTRPTKIYAIYFLQENVLPDLNNINYH